MTKIKDANNLEHDEKPRLKILFAEQTNKMEISQTEAQSLLAELKKEIEARKKTEQALRESDARFRNFFEKAADAIFIAEADSGIIVDANQAACSLVKKPCESIIGQHILSLHPSFSEDFTKVNFDAHKQQLVESFSTKPVENKVVCSDGSVIPVEIIASEVYLNGKRCLMGTFRNISAQKLAEKRYKAIFENAVEGLYQSTPEGKFLAANPAMARILGYDSPESLLNERTNINVQGYADPHGREDFMHKMEQFGSVTGYEYQAARRDGSSVWVSENARLMIDANGQKYYEGSLIDITDRKQTEEALRQKTELLAAAEKIAHLGSWRFNLITRENSWSDEMFRIFGLNPKDLESNIFDFFMKSIHPDDRKMVDEVTQATLSDGLSRPTSYRIIRTDGEVRWVYAEGRPIYDKNGRILEQIGTLQDITERRMAEMELIAAKEKAEQSQHELQQKNKELIERNSFIQTVLDNLPIGVALNTINDGAAKYMNRKFEEIYGWSSAEITSITSFFECVYPDPDYRKKLIDRVLDDVQSGDPARMHWEDLAITHKDGSIHWINAVNIPLPEQNTMVSTVTDITALHKSQTELIAAKEKAEESDRLKSAFLANMSHEIRTPLNSIIGFSDLLHDPFYSDEQQAEFATYIKENGNYLLSIISDIMDFSKIESGQVCIHKKKFSATDLLAKLYSEFVFKTKEKDIELEIALPATDIQLVADQERLRQVLANLLGNAIKFTSKGFVRMGAQTIGKNVQFHVSDTGIGIPPEYQEKIFERFWQVDSSKSRKYGGNGLGLAISKSLVELQGGKIWLESVPGKGSVFYFEIPQGER